MCIRDRVETHQESNQHLLHELQADGGEEGNVGSVGSGRNQESQRPCRVQQGQLEVGCRELQAPGRPDEESGHSAGQQ
eukprot:8808419-Ditylum_brightwellii.AAC.1